MKDPTNIILDNLKKFKQEYPNDTNIYVRYGSKCIIGSDQRSKEY